MKFVIRLIVFLCLKLIYEIFYIYDFITFMTSYMLNVS